MQKLSTLAVALLVACGTEDLVPDAGVVDAGSPTPTDAGQLFEDAAVVPDAGIPPPCDGTAGTFREQTIDVGVEARTYFLHVPASYDCSRPTALLMDFHGTAGDRPEEAYRHAELLALADQEGFIVVRPRSRFSAGPQGTVYRWDENPGDLDRNVTFAVALLDFLRSQYHVDRARTYASGFSSGTNMVAQLLSRPGHFVGYGFVGGGHWNTPNVPPLGADAFRVYAVTGYRDYLWFSVPPLLDTLTNAGLDPENVEVAENDAGHELYAWHFDEMWSWLDRGERRTDDALERGWSLETTGIEGSFTEIETLDRALYVTSAGGDVVHRTANSATWSVVANAVPLPLTGLCVGRDGIAFAVGGQFILKSVDYGATWTREPSAPEFGGMWFGQAYLNDIACPSSSMVVAAGYWSGVASDDGGATWSSRPMHYPGTTFPAQLAAVDVSSSSTAVAAGYFYFGRAAAGGAFESLPMPAGVDWLHGVAHVGQRWWAVGERGTVLFSDDDGVSFTLQDTPIEDDLYDVHFFDADVGLAVGYAGAALYTDDGGQTWSDRRTGHAGFLGGVRFVERTRAYVVGERGVYSFDSTQ